MKIRSENHDTGALSLRATLMPQSIDNERRTADFIFSTGAKVTRYDWWNDENFFEELSLEEEHVNLERFQSGNAPLLKDHGMDDSGRRTYSIDHQIGVIENARLTSGSEVGKPEFDRVGVCTVRFSKEEEHQKYFRQVQDGILKNVSIGYHAHRMVEQEDMHEGMRVFRALNWEPLELSIVTIGADGGANVRSIGKVSTKFEVRSSGMKVDGQGKDKEPTKEIRSGEPVKTEPKAKPAEDTEPSNRSSDPVPPKENTKEIAERAVADERKRTSEITEMGKRHGLETVAQGLVSRGATIEAAKDEFLKNLEERSTKGTKGIQLGEGSPEVHLRSGMVNALLSRSNCPSTKLDDNGKRFRSMSLMQMAERCLREKGEDIDNMSPNNVVSRAFHGASDFPLILEDAMGKRLRSDYTMQPQTFAPFVSTHIVSDYKDIKVYQLGDAPTLKKKLDNGEYKAGSLQEGKESYGIEDYGRTIKVSRQMIINDDLRAFVGLAGKMGRRARGLESNIVWGIITGNPVMGDGNALFSAPHNNVQTPAAISIASLSAMRRAMRLQKGIDSEPGEDAEYIEINGKWLVVPPSLETIAEQFVAQNIVADTAGNTNPFSGKLQVISEPRLESSSAPYPWYVMSDTGEVEMIEIARLRGEEEPILETRENWRTDGAEMKVRFTFGATVLDHRGFQRNVGA